MHTPIDICKMYVLDLIFTSMTLAYAVLYRYASYAINKTGRGGLSGQSRRVYLVNGDSATPSGLLASV